MENKNLNHTIAGLRVYDTFHKMNGWLMCAYREYDFQAWQIQILCDNGRVYEIFESDYVMTPNE